MITREKTLSYRIFVVCCDNPGCLKTYFRDSVYDFMLSIAINRAEHVICATVIIKHNYMLMWNHKIVINIMLCLLSSVDLLTSVVLWGGNAWERRSHKRNFEIYFYYCY